MAGKPRISLALDEIEHVIEGLKLREQELKQDIVTVAKPDVAGNPATLDEHEMDDLVAYTDRWRLARALRQRLEVVAATLTPEE